MWGAPQGRRVPRQMLLQGNEYTLGYHSTGRYGGVSNGTTGIGCCRMWPHASSRVDCEDSETLRIHPLATRLRHMQERIMCPEVAPLPRSDRMKRRASLTHFSRIEVYCWIAHCCCFCSQSISQPTVCPGGGGFFSMHSSVNAFVSTGTASCER
jgi:hypothetical protein